MELFLILLFCAYAFVSRCLILAYSKRLKQEQTKNKDLQTDYELLKKAVVALREAQKDYMNNRGDESKGQIVAHRAFNIDNLLENIE